MSLLAHDNARAKGMELAGGHGKMCPAQWDDEFEDEPWEGSVPHLNERRNPILIWGKANVMRLVEPEAGFAGVGRTCKGFKYRSVLLSIEEARLLTSNCWDSYEQWGYPDKRCLATPIEGAEKESIARDSGSTTVVPEQIGAQCSGSTAAVTAPAMIWLDRPSRPVLIGENPEGVIYSSAAEQFYLAMPAKSGRAGIVTLWLIDTGCGHHLVSLKHLGADLAHILVADRPLTFNTANGKSKATEQAPLYCTELDEDLLLYSLGSTPAVLSLGRRRMHLSYSFIWLVGQKPYFVTPGGTIVHLEVKDDIPYIRVGSEECAPQDAAGTRRVPCAASIEEVVSEDETSGNVAAGGVDDEEGEEVPGDAHPDEEVDAAEDIPPPPAPPAGDARPAKRDLKAEAESLEHKLSHIPKNIHCDTCVRSKMKNANSGSFQREPKAWGDISTADHLDARKKEMVGLIGEREALTVKDLYSGLRNIYATKTKSAEETHFCITKFVGESSCSHAVFGQLRRDREGVQDGSDCS
jgi:hypothetical protein